jgi:hypothetical protein
MIDRAVSKFQSEEVEIGLLITPAWPGLTALPLVTDLLITDPVFLPERLLEGHRPTRHPFHLMAWLISTNIIKRQAYHSLRDKRCLKASLQKPCSPMSSTGDVFMDGLITMGINCQFPFP